MTIDKVALPLLLLILKRQLIHRHIAARRMRQKLISGRSVIPCGTSNTRAGEHPNSRARSRQRERQRDSIRRTVSTTVTQIATRTTVMNLGLASMVFGNMNTRANAIGPVPIQSNPIQSNQRVVVCESRSIRETAADLQASPHKSIHPSSHPFSQPSLVIPRSPLNAKIN